MPKGSGTQTRVHYKGDNENFIVMVENGESVREWRKDRSIPLAQVVDGFKIFVNHHQGNQGVLDEPSNGQLDSEFGTHKDDEVIKIILEKGDILDTGEKGRAGGRNDTQGGMMSHNP